MFITRGSSPICGDCTRIRIGWNEFRQLVPLTTNRDVSLIDTAAAYEAVCCMEVRPGL